MLLPGCESAPSHLDQVLEGFSSFYLIRNLPVHELLDRNFLQAAVFQGNVCPHTCTTTHTHLRTVVQSTVVLCPPQAWIKTHLVLICVCVCLSGSVYGLSHRTRIDEDNCVALMPNGEVS